MKTTIVLVIDHKKPIADLTDIAAGRIYTLDGVEDVTAVLCADAEAAGCLACVTCGQPAPEAA